MSTGVQEKLGIMNGGCVFAVFGYQAARGDELSFSVGARLHVLRKGDDSEREWWWSRDPQGREGYVPRNLLGVSLRTSTLHRYYLPPKVKGLIQKKQINQLKQFILNSGQRLRCLSEYRDRWQRQVSVDRVQTHIQNNRNR